MADTPHLETRRPAQDGGLPQAYFDTAYQGTPPWEIAAPQPAFVRLQEAGGIQGVVLDVGCGTGDLAIYLARQGHAVWGADFAPQAIATARQKAAQQACAVEFVVHDVLDLGTLPRQFDTIVDSGCFHVFDDTLRPYFAASLYRALRPGGVYHMLAMGISLNAPGMPHAVTALDIQQTFGTPWQILDVAAALFLTRTTPEGRPATFASIRRV